ncbi:hypothetical protein H8744_06345 [Oscillospiraceae bacterium N12]|jgi:thiopeptide-type bacteriocin biosynthesis protein|uniref:Thiopeptide-type bacteriocin biosynthesis domain-containing protein n=1 Tax=Jilunia laotingensis TaxID=2763675 RepID=A0A926F6N9_9BACT|nr:thiopeptide-type bacteriocin biosynthesis protein [Jilunia laotingensis]MBC8592879.1 hypothetical protein [Jilunia laotingensis]
MVKRLFIPGSQWIYFKIYTGEQTADNILIENVMPFIHTLYNEGVIMGSFFVRYSDPLFHLRLRLYVDKLESYATIFSNLLVFLEPCLNNGSIFRIMCDTYNRELERYGNELIKYVEEIFCIDSWSILSLLSILQKYDEDLREYERWNLSLLLIDDLLNVFDFDGKSKKQYLCMLSEQLKLEHGFINHKFTKQLNDKYRTNKSNVWRTMDRENSVVYIKYSDILNRRKNDLEEITKKLNKEELQWISDYSLSSLIHMTMNRFFKSKNRLHEMVIYFFLYKYYDSYLARFEI